MSDAPHDDDDELANAVGDFTGFAGVVAQQIPPELRQRPTTWVPPNTPPPRIFWWDRRSWRFWWWFSTYAVAGVVDLLIIIAAVSGR